jgi:hypothetical protein
MIDLKEIDDLITKQKVILMEVNTQLNDLRFLRDKLIYGTDDEKKLFRLIGRMTVENINRLMKDFKTVGVYP